MINHQSILCRQVLVVLLVVLIATTARTGRAEDTFELGNQAYAEGNFPAAVQNYLSTAATRGVSSSLLYNLANSYAATGKTGEAILAYEQALRLEHGNGDIRSSLAGIRKKAGLYSEDHPVWQRLLDLLGADQWLLLSGFSFFICSSCLLIRSLAGSLINYTQAGKESIIRIARYGATGALITALFALPAAVYGYRNWGDAVVLTDTRLQISPFAAAASGGAIREGRIVRPVKKHNTYILVTDDSGRKGWLNRKELGFIKKLPKPKDR